MKFFTTQMLSTFLLAGYLVSSVITPSALLAKECNQAAADKKLSKISDKYKSEFNVREQFREVGTLAAGKEKYITLNLFKGNEYIFFLAGSDCAEHVEILIYDQMGLQVDKVKTTTDVAEIRLKAKYSGTYFVKVSMKKASEEAHWSFTYGYK